MSRKRNPENRGLPARWRHTHGAYFYRVPPGLEARWEGKRQFLLGRTLPDAYAEWAKRMQVGFNVSTVSQLLDRYALQVIPSKAPATQRGNKHALPELRKRFGHMPLLDLKPQHIYQYVDHRGAQTAAQREIEVLSHAYTKAVEWGLIDRHPFKDQVRLKNAKPRTRYIEDWELLEVLTMKPRNKRGGVRMIQAYITVKLLTGLRRGDLLRLHTSRDLDEGGIRVQAHKTAATTGRRWVISWSDELRVAIDAAKAARPVDIAPWLFCTKAGKPYVDEATGRTSGWDSMWQRFMARVLKETKVTQRFTEHDLRAKCASDAESLERARQLLGHADARLTERVYRRKVEVVRPLR